MNKLSGNLDGYLKAIYGPDVLKTALNHDASYAHSKLANRNANWFARNTFFHRAGVAMHTRVSGHEKVVVALLSGLSMATFFVFAVVVFKKKCRLKKRARIS